MKITKNLFLFRLIAAEETPICPRKQFRFAPVHQRLPHPTRVCKLASHPDLQTRVSRCPGDKNKRESNSTKQNMKSVIPSTKQQSNFKQQQP